MALIPENRYPGKTTPATGDYPYGSAKNVALPGDGTGTPWEKDIVNDLFGFQQAILTRGAVVPSGTPDTADASQYLQALLNVAGAILPLTESALTEDLSGVPRFTSSGFVTAGDGGGATWVATGVTTPGSAGTTDYPNGFIYDSEGTQFKIDVSHLHVRQFGAFGTGDETTELAAAFGFAFSEKKAIEVDGTTTYTVSNVLLDSNSNTSFVLFAAAGRAKFVYSGSAIESLINSQELLFSIVKNIEIDCANLIGVPLDLRNVSTPNNGGYVSLENVITRNISQTTQTKNPAGLQVLGGFANVDVINCGVYGVQRTNVALACTGISISDLTGIASVRGCHVENISTPDDKDADGLKIFGDNVPTATATLEALAEVHNNTFKNCEGRCIKLQISNSEVHGNKLIMDDGQTTIPSWHCIDVQSNNSNIHDNTFRFGSGITWGVSASIVVFQNIRNDGNAKTSYFTNNRISTQTAGLRYMVEGLAEFDESSFYIENNEVLGETIVRGFQIAANGGAAVVDKINAYYRNNTVIDYSGSDIFNPFNQENFGAKMYLEIIDNKVLTSGSSSRIHGALSGFELDQFKISNNTNNTNRIDWPFDMDDLPGGNNFFVGSQTVTNKGPGATTFFHVEADSNVQRNINTLGTVLNRRTSNDGITWQAWV